MRIIALGDTILGKFCQFLFVIFVITPAFYSILVDFITDGGIIKAIGVVVFGVSCYFIAIISLSYQIITTSGDALIITDRVLLLWSRQRIYRFARIRDMSIREERGTPFWKRFVTEWRDFARLRALGDNSIRFVYDSEEVCIIPDSGKHYCAANMLILRQYLPNTAFRADVTAAQ